MDPSDSAYTSINRNDNLDVAELHFQSQNPQSNELNEIYQNTCIADKSVLENILHTVSLLSASNVCDDNLTENDEPGNKISSDSHMSSDSEEIEIVDVVVGENNHQQNSFNGLSANAPNSSANAPILNCSNSSESLTAPDILSIIESNISEVDVEITSEEDLEKYSSRVPVVMNRDSASKEYLPVSSSETVDSASESETIKEYEIYRSCPEKCTEKSTKEPIDVEKNEVPSDSAMLHEIFDLTNEIDECSTYDIEYDFNHIPTQITGSWKELNSSKKNNFTRGCKWAPDGSCILTCSDDNKLRIFNLPSQLWDSSQWCDISELEVALRIHESDLIYDYCWYPLMNSSDASTCCLVSSSRKSTVHMWDGYTGKLRCSYRSFNHLDELVTPHSLSFDSDGEKLFCGFRNVIRVFDVNRPGRSFEERQTYACKTGQCGIISCFAFTSADKNISAAGTYKSTIGLYAEPYGELSCLLEGQANGITQLKFSPDGQYLYSGGRKDPEILCWDLRNLGTVLFSLRRLVETNQRMYFDISKCGKYVVSGNQNGVITFWDVTTEPKIINESDFPVLIPVQFFLAHDDCVNGISFHPSYPLLCSSSGQRKFPVLMDDDSDAIFSPDIEKQDNSLRLWWIGKLNK